MAFEKSSKEKTNNTKVEPIVFLDLPIKSYADDVIGFEAYVESLSLAIDSGAQSIAITSDFGTGKSSIIELLKEKRKSNKNDIIIEVPMWSQLQSQSDSNDLHKNFIFQIANQISHNRGTYISRRLNSNFELLKLHTNRRYNWIIIVIAIVLLILSWIIRNFAVLFETFIPFVYGNANLISTLSVIVSVILIVIAASFAEVIYSIGNKGEKRIVEPDEIMEVYYSEILKYRKVKFCNSEKNKKHYIVVVEDLDRSNETETVRAFLKEFRKYYIINDDKTNSFKNKVTFIVNIKPEALLVSQDTKTNNEINGAINNNKEVIYEKVFDYIVNLQKINISDYDAVLSSLLAENKEKIENLKLIDPEKPLVEIKGMQWIIREPLTGIRQVKERLNRAFSLYESLSERFPNMDVSFEKCSVVSYVTTAFEGDFCKTPDAFFDELVNYRIKGESILDNYDNSEKFDKKYMVAIAELIDSGLIDDNYRVYFYSYPKKGHVLTNDEEQVQKAILYGKAAISSIDLNESVLHVQESGSAVIANSLKKIRQLNIFVKDIVFNTENLYKAVLKYDAEYIYEALEQWNYEADSAAKTIDRFISILSYDPTREIYTQDIIKRFVALWEERFDEEQLLKLRFNLSMNFPEEIERYSELFMGTHSLARFKELDNIPYETMLGLFNKQNEDFNDKCLEYVLNRYSLSPSRVSLNDATIKFINESAKHIEATYVAPTALKFMLINETIIDELEEVVIDNINNGLEKGLDLGGFIDDYKELIIMTAPNGLSMRATNYIRDYNDYDGYSGEVAKELTNGGYLFEAAMVSVFLNRRFSFSNDRIKDSILEQKAWLIDNPKELSLLRGAILGYSKKTIWKYAALFDKDCPVITEDEFDLAANKISASEIKYLLPPEVVTETETSMIIDFINSKEQNVIESFKILEYISELEKSVARICFEKLLFGECIKYQDFDDEQKQTIKSIYSDILKLNKAEEKLQYMQTTKCLDYDFEKALSSNINSNSAFKENYIKTISLCNSGANEMTISLLCGFKNHYALPGYVTDLLYEKGKYENYVISKTLYESKFKMEDGERGEILWPTYVDIFRKNKDSIVSDYMGENYTFVQKMMENKVFVGLNDDLRIKFAKVPQSAESITELESRELVFVIKYLSESEGFVDITAAAAFVDLMSKRTELIASDDLYDNLYLKLVNPDLKRRYTRLRKHYRD